MTFHFLRLVTDGAEVIHDFQDRFREPLGGDFPAVYLDSEVQARLDDFAVEQNRASAAFADHATHMGPGQTDGLAEKMRE